MCILYRLYRIKKKTIMNNKHEHKVKCLEIETVLALQSSMIDIG